MTLTQLRYLVAIADSGLNITLAAERVHATQPGLSRQLKHLEDELGFQLFARRGRSLEAVTDGGRQVLAHARRALAEAANIRSYAANRRGEAHGRLTIATTHTQARFVLPAAVARTRQDFPGVSIHLQPVADAEVLERLAIGQADFALLSSTGEPPGGGVAVPLFRWQRQVLVPAGHPLADAGTPTLEQLAAFPLVTYESAQQPASSLRRAFADHGLEPQLAMTARDADLIKTYVRAGMGVGLLAEMALGADDAGLRALPAPASIPGCVAWAVLPRDRVQRDYALALLHALAPQLDRRDLRRVLEGNQDAAWPAPPAWRALSQSIDV